MRFLYLKFNIKEKINRVQQANVHTREDIYIFSNQYIFSCILNFPYRQRIGCVYPSIGNPNPPFLEIYIVAYNTQFMS